MKAVKKMAKPAERRTPVVVIPVADLTYIEQAHKATSKAYRAIKRWLNK